ncbi:MAG: ATP-binding protein [Phycisphaerae bacterium]|nr:ATP-binding protein [Phycisphaerae bacterium]
MQDFEKLGAFYLGKVYDVDERARRDEIVMYDSKDLVTHAVCVGMTGSGKTGLCVGLIEEAAIDGIPSIVIDPKGDLSNLLLTFPELRAADFRAWVNAEDATKAGLSVDEFAGKQAEAWSKGLAEWGQSGERIGRLRGAADFAIYTPGSSAGIPVSVLRSFEAPPPALVEDRELFRERVSGTVSSLLGLLSIEADPLRSREHILLSTILTGEWSAGRGVDLAALIRLIQQPPTARIGVMDLETFFPAADRFALAMQMNSLLAAPGFEAWMEGEALDIGSILYTPAGKPRVAVFSIAHLNDAERMFFVSLLFNQILAWVRQQSGTTSLRALVYMDEIAGYFPPVANPPSKQAMLTLMKQARAFGVGMVLATQNPVDLDYKGLANAGTWFLGRLQTERDKARVLDGLEGAAAAASAAFDRDACDRILSGLGSRVFLMNNVHEDGPVVFQTRWTMSYLRGPLTRGQIKQLSGHARGGAGSVGGVGGASESTLASDAAGGAPGVGAPIPGPASRATPGLGPTIASASGTSSVPAPVPAPEMTRSPATTPAASRVNISTAARVGADRSRPVLAPEIPQYFLPARVEGGVVYVPMVLGLGKVFFSDSKLGVEETETHSWLAAFGGGPIAVDWEHAERVDVWERDLDKSPADGAAFESVPTDAAKAKSYELWKKDLAGELYRSAKLELLQSPSSGEVSKLGESEKDFRLRLQQAAREDRDAKAEQLRRKYAPKMTTLQERIRRAEQQLAVQEEQAKSAKMQTAISFGSAILSAFLGRKKISSGNVGRVGTVARGMTRQSKESSDVDRAEDTVGALRVQLKDLEAQFQSDLDAMVSKIDPLTEELETIALKPKKTNVTVPAVVLCWVPHVRGAAGLEGAWR